MPSRCSPPLIVHTHRHPPHSTLFPYTTLFRSDVLRYEELRAARLSSRPKGVATAVSTAASTKLAIKNTGNQTGSGNRSEEHTSELQSRFDLVCRLLLEKKNKKSKRANNEIRAT